MLYVVQEMSEKNVTYWIHEKQIVNVLICVRCILRFYSRYKIIES